MPIVHRSNFASQACLLSISGQRQSMVPQKVLRFLVVCMDHPKSDNLMMLLLQTSMFSGLRSRCMMFMLCRYCIAFTICLTQIAASRSLSAPLSRSILQSSPPAAYYKMMQTLFSSKKNPYILSTFSCLRWEWISISRLSWLTTSSLTNCRFDRTFNATIWPLLLQRAKQTCPYLTQNKEYLPLPMCLPTWKLSIDHYYGLNIFPPESDALGIQQITLRVLLYSFQQTTAARSSLGGSLLLGDFAPQGFLRKLQNI